MNKSIVAIVGRPNVGKSTLFNTLAGSNIAIVKDTPGVTRDRIYADVEWVGREFTLIDTGGIEPKTDDYMLKRMREQAQTAVELADVILFITDVKQGLVDTDFQVADMLRKSNKPVILVVNKVDDFQKYMPDVYEFYNLGIGEPSPVSSRGKLGIGDMLDRAVELLPKGEMKENEKEEVPQIAVIGKPNVGKSSLINYLLGEERLIVSDVAGTTRDAIDTSISYQNREYVFIDTAGLRRKSKVNDDIERYSNIRTVAAVQRANVVVLMIDAKEGITGQDAKIAGLAHEAGKGLIIAVNKWDDIEKDTKTSDRYIKEIRQVLSFADYAVIVFISAKTGQRINKLFESIDMVRESCLRRVSTGVINEVLAEAVAAVPPPHDKGRALKLYYMTQVAVEPPTFVVFVNDKNLMHFSYERYLENTLRNAFGFKGTVIRILTRAGKEDKLA